MTFKIKQRPVEPKRKEFYESFYFDLDGSDINGLEDVVRVHIKDHYEPHNMHWKNAGITVDSFTTLIISCNSDCDGYVETKVVGTRLESDYEYSYRNAAYLKRLKEYEAWFKINKDKVEAELRDRELRKQTHTDKQKQIRIDKLEKELRKLKK